MEEEAKRETRQRSRSKTPLTLRSSVDRDIEVDGEKKKVKKAPNVETISEESPAPAPAAEKRPQRTKRATAKASANNDNAPNDSNVNKDTAALIANSIAVVPSAISASEQNVAVTKTTIVTTTKSVKNSGGDQILNEKQQSQITTTTKSSAASQRSRENVQNESNFLLEQNSKLKTSTPNRSSRTNKEPFVSFNDANVTTNGNDIKDHPAYKEYVEAGEYWNKFPKTDYTYSKLSQQRREVKPGVIAMPNMSRRSLDHHQERVHSMIRRDPAQESFFRSRYEALTTLRKRNAADSYYDSQDETDLSYGLNGGRYTTSTQTSFIRRLITIITTFFSSSYQRITSVFRRKQTFSTSAYYTRLGDEKRGIIARTWQKIRNGFLAVFRYIYLGISSVLFLDSWLLQRSQVSSGKKKGFLLGLLILLPLLLLGGTYYYLDKPAPIPNINISLDQIIDPQLIDNVKTISIEQYNNVVNISSDYMLYVKAAIQNSATEAKKLWSENFPYSF